jgi:catechol 2,3-dioxygenase-like lactoylglutathione lyase family enzyme
MFDHVAIRTHDLNKSVRFYEKALAPLGFKKSVSFDAGAGFGKHGSPSFWIVRMDDTPTTAAHFAFSCDSRSEVERFYKEAMAAGGTDNGPPEIQEEYGPHYFSAFVLDLDGNNVEAVFHER